MATLKPYMTVQGPIYAFNTLSGVCQSITLAGSAKNIPVTTGATVCRICANVDIYIEADATASLPSGDVTSGASVYLPAGVPEIIHCEGVTNISVVGDSAVGDVNATFFGESA